MLDEAIFERVFAVRKDAAPARRQASRDRLSRSVRALNVQQIVGGEFGAFLDELEA
jgi:hypothetical protein